VILDSAVGLHQGGQVSAPVFKRVTQQVLEYLHVPHDLPLAPKHQLLMAKTVDKDLEEGTPDHPGEPLETAEMNTDAAKPAAAPQAPAARAAEGPVVQAAMREPIGTASSQPVPIPSAPSGGELAKPTSGTVVLDVEQGGIEVPLFLGKTVRSAVQAAQDAGLELEVIGSGIARQQSPAAGSHVQAGSRVNVQFGR